MSVLFLLGWTCIHVLFQKTVEKFEKEIRASLHLASSRVFGISIPLDRPCSRRPRQRLSLRFFCHLAYSDLLCRSGTHSAQEPSLPLQWCKSDVQLGSEESDHHLCHLWLVLQGHSSICVCDLPMAECPRLSH